MIVQEDQNVFWIETFAKHKPQSKKKNKNKQPQPQLNQDCTC